MQKKDDQPGADEFKRAFVRPTARVPAGPQIAALVGAGAGAIYVLGKHRPLAESGGARIYTHTDARDVWLRSLDARCVAMVVTAGRLGGSRAEIKDTVRRVHERGAYVLEVETGRRSDDPAVAAEMMLDAADELSGVRKGRFDSKSGKRARAGQLAEHDGQRLARSRAAAIWKDTAAYPLEADALAAMPGWKARTAYLHFGPRYPNDPSRGGRGRKRLQRRKAR